jgi:hypothetical protein
MNVIPFPARHRSAGSAFAFGAARIGWSEEIMRTIQAAVGLLAEKTPAGESIEIKTQVATEGSRIWFTMRLDGNGVSLVDAWTD